MRAMAQTHPRHMTLSERNQFQKLTALQPYLHITSGKSRVVVMGSKAVVTRS